MAAAFFIKQPRYFFLEIFLFKESPKKIRTFILTSMMNKNSIITFHGYFLRRHLKTFPIYLGKYLTNSVQNWPEVSHDYEINNFLP